MNCTRPNDEIERLGQRRDEQRLGEARHADEERVPAREQRDEHQLDDVLLPDDAHGDRLAELAARVARHLEQLARRPSTRRRRSGRLTLRTAAGDMGGRTGCRTRARRCQSLLASRPPTAASDASAQLAA